MKIKIIEGNDLSIIKLITQMLKNDVRNTKGEVQFNKEELAPTDVEKPDCYDSGLMIWEFEIKINKKYI